MNSKTKVLLNKKVSQVSDACPTVTHDIKEAEEMNQVRMQKIYMAEE